MIETHGKDLQITGSQEPSRSGTPQPTSASTSAQSSAPAASGPTSKVIKEQKKPLNTSKVEVEGSFMASADDLFEMLTDESKIPMWTRAAAQVSVCWFLSYLSSDPALSVHVFTSSQNPNQASRSLCLVAV